MEIFILDSSSYPIFLQRSLSSKINCITRAVPAQKAELGPQDLASVKLKDHRSDDSLDSSILR